MKKVLVIGTLCLIAIACRNAGSSSHLCVHTDPVPVAPEATNGDEYLYTITVNDLDFFAAGEIIKKYYDVNEARPAGCSSVRPGKYYGRNLDYYVNKNADFVITTPASKNRYASIGMSADFPLCLKESVDNGTLTEEDYAAIAYYMTDGINEKGVAINGNVGVASELISQAESQYVSVEYQKSIRTAKEWYTTHSIVYDLEEKTMSLIAQENDTVWEFKL